MQIEKTCVCCEKKFFAAKNNAKYCSTTCKDIVYRRNHGIKANYNPDPQQIVCVICGKEFDSRRETQKTCSPECARKLRGKHRGKRKSYPRKVGEWHFVESQNQMVMKRLPQYEYIGTDNLHIRLKCKECGNIIDRTASGVRKGGVQCEYCKELKKERKDLYYILLAVKEIKTPKICVGCETVFYSLYPTQKYCTNKCKKRVNKKHIRRAKEHGGDYEEGITLYKLIQRDDNVCQICGKTCDSTDKSWGTSGPLYPSIDHIVPIAKGGDHTWKNIQLAHIICNSTKRDLIYD